ncbi:Lipoyltransferase and lipoate-protein ligase [Phellopilus nigrolimitatus]|nr:Lipoyltransferase and lipoate-protein ligase [Phellopilus nigrolimitatus]
MKLGLFHHLKRCARAPYSTRCRELNPNHSVYVSNSTNPYFNLSLEDWLFRNKNNQEPLLLLYRDDPCVVIGRNQNPWKEVNLQLASTQKVPFIRRRSGGGTVYHDLGNTNYSLHLSRTAFDRNETAKVIVRAVRSLGIDAEVNDRNDVCAGGYKICYIWSLSSDESYSADVLAPFPGLHLSGSAYKIVNKRAYHHGTMLISTKLNTLGKLLHTTKETMITKGVASVRSPVQNLQRFNSEVTHECFVKAVIQSFREKYNIDEEPKYVEEEEDSLGVQAIRDGMEELKGWDWLYGQTPEFTYSVSRTFDWGESRAEITSKHGVILSCKIECPGIDSDVLEKLGQRIQGLKYGFITEFGEGDWQESEGGPLRVREIWNWVREETSK